MSADRNLLFAVLALQADCVTREQFIDACTAWAANKSTPIDALMVQKGWLTPEDRGDVERLVKRKLKKHGGNVRKSLAEAAGEDVRQSLAEVPDSDLRQSLAAGWPADFVGLATLPPSVTSGPSRYSLSRIHATGGIGRVWLAHDTAMGRSVALKELRPERAGEPAIIERFVKEARITGQLEHPGIVPIYELARRPEGGEPFYTMRFIRGRTLAAAIRRFHDPKLPPPQSPVLAFRELLTAFLGACNAAAYAHSRGVIHRDLKPANIVLGDYGEVIVLDWGMAKVLPVESGSISPEADVQTAALSTRAEPPPRIEPSGEGDGQTVAGLVIGTPAYMPPEQAEGRRDLHDQRSDVYALGAILYEILTGVTPFDAPNMQALLEKVRRDPPPLPRIHQRGVPRALEPVCLKALAKRREDRYPSVLALADDVQHWLADEPVSCYTEPLPVRAGRWARKHKPLVATAGAVLLTAAVGLAVGLYFVNAEKNRTELARRGEERQRIAAEQSEYKAKTEAATATAVKEFLQRDLLQLAAAREQYSQEASGVKMDPDLKVRDLVLRAAKKIEGKFADQPMVEAEIRSTLGWTLYQIGRADLAIPQYLRVGELCAARLGPDHPHTLVTMRGLAISYAAAGRTQDALKLSEETLQLSKAKLGPDHPDTLASMNNLAISYDAAGRTHDALKLHQETLELKKATLGPDHPDTLASMNNLAISYDAAGRTHDALALREETLQLQKAKLGPNHPDTLTNMMNLASSYDAAGRAHDALMLREETLELKKATLGPDHTETLMSMNNLAESYRAVGRTHEALKLHEEALQLLRAKLGPDHRDTLGSMNNLAESYRAAGRTHDALKLHQETLQLRRTKLGPDHPDTLSSMGNLANSYAAAGRTQEALKLHEETLQLKKAKLGPDHPETLLSMGSLSNSYDAAGRGQDALKLREETLQLEKAKLGPDHPHSLMSMNNLANSHAAAGRSQDALKLHEETLKLMKAKLGPDHPETLKTMNNLARSYIGTGQPSKALELLLQTLSLRERRSQAQPGNVMEESFLARTHGQLGEAEQARQDYAAAVSAYARAVEMFDKLDKSGMLTDPSFRRNLNGYRQRLTLCQKAQQAVRDLDFVLKQPAAEVPSLLDIRVRFLLKERKPAAAVESAAKLKQLAGDKPDRLYYVARLYALCAGANATDPEMSRLTKKCADEAMTLLKQAVAKGYTNAARMKQNQDLAALRQRADFQKLLADLDRKK